MDSQLKHNIGGQQIVPVLQILCCGSTVPFCHILASRKSQVASRKLRPHISHLVRPETVRNINGKKNLFFIHFVFGFEIQIYLKVY